MSKMIDLTGRKFGLLTVTGYAGKDKHRLNTWNCLCECGNTHVTYTSALLQGRVKSCGCYHRSGKPYKGRRNALTVAIVNRDTLRLEVSNNWILIDKEDLERVLPLSFSFNGKHGISCGATTDKQSKFSCKLARFILGNVPKDKVVDHINGEPRDNRKANLRVCTLTENNRNKVACRGYSYNKWRKKWVARLKLDGKTVFNKAFETEEEARAARYEAEKRYFGEFAPIRGAA